MQIVAVWIIVERLVNDIMILGIGHQCGPTGARDNSDKQNLISFPPSLERPTKSRLTVVLQVYKCPH